MSDGPSFIVCIVLDLVDNLDCYTASVSFLGGNGSSL